jgi:sarcosine oxidase subunit gamma
MSDSVSALKNASYSAGIAQIIEVGAVGMITLRGDINTRGVQKGAVDVAGVKMPEPRHCVTDGAAGLAWMSPDELLLMCDYTDAHAKLVALNAKLSKVHALAANVSDARAVFEVRGAHAREVMAKVAPVDLARDQFKTGMFRRTRIAQVPAAFWMPQEDVFRVVCFRSVAQYVFDVLSVAAQPGSEVGYV